MNFDIPLHEIREQVLDFMRELDCYPVTRDQNLILDGTLHRYTIEGDKRSTQNGAYCIFTDGFPAGFVQNWKGEKSNWKFNANKSSISQEQRNWWNSPEYRKKLEEKQKQRDAELKARYAKASENARIHFESYIASPEIQHPYLTRKNIKVYGARFYNQEQQIAVPLYDIDGRFQSLQWISEDGEKRFFPGASTSGAFFPIGIENISNDNDRPILICEGFATGAKIHQLTGLPTICAMSSGNIRKVAKLINGKYKGHKVIIMADNDRDTAKKRGNNPGISASQDAVNSKDAVASIFPEFKEDEIGSDWDDYALIYGDEDTAKLLKEKIKWACLTEKEQKIFSQVEQIDAQTLRKKIFPPTIWAIDGFLPAGLSILAGGPKVGKSILSLHISLAVAIGGCALGKINVEKGDVLYLALEDTQRRLQERIEGSNLPDNVNLSRLTLVTQIPRQHEGGIEYIQWWLKEHSRARLVIIDTLQKFRKQLSTKGNIYSEDYDAVSDIKKLADKVNVPFLVIHHLKKAMAEDWLNELSGSQGIAGAADTIFSLKRARTDKGGILHRTGRDVEEKDFAMELDNFSWILKDDVTEFTMPEWKRQIVNFLKEHNSVTPMELSGVLNLPLKTAQKNLARLAKEEIIIKIGYGSYSLMEHQI